jgi:hypothetical protein
MKEKEMEDSMSSNSNSQISMEDIESK